MSEKDIILAKTVELGEAILKSQEYLNMQKACKAVENDSALTTKINTFYNYEKELNQEGSKENGDSEKFELLYAQFEKINQELSENELIVEMIKAKEIFSQFVSEVNNKIRFAITGIDDDNPCSKCESRYECNHTAEDDILQNNK